MAAQFFWNGSNPTNTLLREALSSSLAPAGEQAGWYVWVRPILVSQLGSEIGHKKAALPGAQCYLVGTAALRRFSHSGQINLHSGDLLTLHLPRVCLMEFVLAPQAGCSWQETRVTVFSPGAENAPTESYSPGSSRRQHIWRSFVDLFMSRCENL